MSLELRRAIFEQLNAISLIDPHSHINPLDPGSHNLADILGYHYYTELAHSAGMPKELIEEPGIDPKEKVRRIVEGMGPIENTIQYSWFIEIANQLFGFPEERVDADSWESLYDIAHKKMAAPDWARHVLRKSNIEAVFLTNEFDDALEGFDTSVYIPCLRTDDLVFHFARPQVRERLENCTLTSLEGLASLHEAINRLFDHFTKHNARACAISLPPDFSPTMISQGRATTALAAVLRDGLDALESHRKALSNYIFWLLADHCRAYGLPFDLMIGVNRGVYENGVYQGRDLYDSRVSLHQYKQLFNAFPDVTFPISVLASVTNQELTSYAWIFPNVVTNGHWWYSNTPTFIEHDLAARLEAVPATKQIGYYSDMYKLEFGLPKFAMYKRILAKVLAERFVQDRGWSETRAIELGQKVLRGNVEHLFMRPLPDVDLSKLPVIAAKAGPVDAWSDTLQTAGIAAVAGAAVTAGIGISAAPKDEDWSPNDSEPQVIGERHDFVYQPKDLDEEATEEQFNLSESVPVAEETIVETTSQAPRWEALQEKPSLEAVIETDDEEADIEVRADEVDDGWPQAPLQEMDDSLESEEPLDLNSNELEPLEDTDIQSLDDDAFENFDELDPPK